MREKGLRFGIECGLVVLHCLVRILFEIRAGALILPTGPLTTIIACLATDFVPWRWTAMRFIFLCLKEIEKGDLSVKWVGRKAISNNDLVQRLFR